MEDIMDRWPSGNDFDRICIQTLCYDGVVDDVIDIAVNVGKVSDAPISTAIHPVSKQEMQRIKDAGTTDIGVALDACTPELFERVKGADRGVNYRWESHRSALVDALGIFGHNHVTTHLIIGLGETEREAADFIFEMNDLGIGVGLFAFTPIRGTSLEDWPPPSVETYRRVQVVRYLVQRDAVTRDMVRYEENGRISIDLEQSQLRELLASGTAFRVSGCRGCNRPYYNERPSGTLYNYHRPLSEDESKAASEETGLV